MYKAPHIKQAQPGCIFPTTQHDPVPASAQENQTHKPNCSTSTNTATLHARPVHHSCTPKAPLAATNEVRCLGAGPYGLYYTAAGSRTALHMSLSLGTSRNCIPCARNLL